MARKQKKKSHLFYSFYFILMAIAVCLVFMLCASIRSSLAVYEASQPKYAAEDYARMFLTRDFEKVYSFQDPADFAGADAATYAAYMNLLIGDHELTWGESYSPSEDEAVYAVRLNGKRLFEFTLIKLPEKGEKGEDLWTLADVRTLGITQVIHKLRVPSTSTVYLNDHALGEDDIIERDIALISDDYLLDDSAHSPTMCVYQYATCFSEPKISVIDENGRENVLTVAEDGCLEAQINSDDALKARAEERVIEIVKAFANFTSEDLSKNRMLRLVRKGTKGYDKLERFDNDWFGPHEGNDFENMRTENYIVLSEDTFACDIHFDYVIHYEDTDDRIYKTNYRFYFVERDGIWYLYDFEMVS